MASENLSVARKLSGHEKEIIRVFQGVKLDCPHCHFLMDPRLRFCPRCRRMIPMPKEKN